MRFESMMITDNATIIYCVTIEKRSHYFFFIIRAEITAPIKSWSYTVKI